MKPSYEELEEQLNRSRRLCDAALANERVWETAMMQACGEDGPKSVADKFAALEAKCAALAAENAGLKDALECVINLNNQPEYHDQGMGCGVEDRGYQRDGYSACYYGWESAMERVYSEVIPDAIPETPATDSFLAEVRAQGVEMAACALDDVNQFNYANMLDDLAQKIRKGVQS